MGDTELEKVVMIYAKEKNAIKQELAEKEQELRKCQAQLYDSNCKVEQLEAWYREQRRNEKKAAALNNRKKNNPKPKLTRAEKASAKPRRGTLHPIIPKHEEVADDSTQFYRTVSKLCSDAKLSVILQAEKLFLEADKNGDGIVDEKELDDLFVKHMALYTRGQVAEILSTADTDGSSTLDFIETVEIIQRIDSGDEQSMPSEIKRDSKGSVTCSVQ